MGQSDFLNSPEWKKLSTKIRLRDKKCLRCGSTDRLCADHIIPRRYSKEFELSEFNIQTLCWKCNDKKSYDHIVYFGNKKNPSIEIEIEKLKQKFFKRFRNHYHKQLSLSNYNRALSRKRTNPNELDKLEKVFDDIFNIPERSKNPFIKTTAFVARVLSMPISIPAYVLLQIAQSFSDPSISKRATKMASDRVETIFNDWK